MTHHEKERKQHKTLSDFFSASQMRSDRWTTLKGLAAQLVDASEHKREKIMARTLDLLDALDPIEAYWAFPGNRSLQQLRRLLARNDLDEFAHAVSRITRALMSGSYRRRYIDPWPDSDESAQPDSDEPESPEQRTRARNYFEVLVVDDLTEAQEDAVRDALRDMRRDEDKFVYSTVVVPSLTDALIAVMFNYNIQSVVVRNDFNIESGNKLDLLRAYLDRLDEERIDEIDREECGPELCRLLRKVRPEVDVFLVTDRSVEDIASRGLAGCRRVFYNLEDYMELHLNILRGVYARYQTPFFTALKEYSRQPTGVFHAMPISRGKSIIRSNWIRDMGDFYGMNIFLAETSATSGGLDSLLEPQGPIKRAQELAARAFGSRQTFFATNGTSTCNKIVVQAHRAPRRHRADRPRLPQVAPLRHGAGRRPCGVPGQLPAVRIFHVRRGAAELDQAPAAGTQARRQAGPGAHAAADQLHLRRHRLQRRAGDAGMPGDQARPGVPVGRGLVRVCALRRHLPPAHRHARGARPCAIATAARTTARPGTSTARRWPIWMTRQLVEHAADARSGQGARARLLHPVHPQDPDRAAPGLDDPRARPGLPRRGGAGLPRGLHDPHLHLAQLPDHRLAGCRPSPGGAGRLRAGAEADRGGHDHAQGGGLAPAAVEILHACCRWAR